jgi:mannose/fructose/N-acetylgalactosamine-specific phosphotransferase system component IIB
VGIALLRVDERLIHGQVTVGWGARLQPTRYLVVDDELAQSDWERELMSLGAPSDALVEFLTVQTARGLLEEWISSTTRSVLLTRDLDHMVRLARGGLLEGMEVNLGGLHHAAGREEVLPYLFLTSQDRERIVELEEEGAIVSARDLPSSPRRNASDLLG